MKYQMFVIRILDIALSMMGLIILFWPMILISLAIYFEDRKSPFFTQRRVGCNRREFTILKFRSMKVDPHRNQGENHSLNERELPNARNKFLTTRENDPRITSVGRLLRASHLDELPQFINVILGDMSIVGVRPDTPIQEVDYSKEYWVFRHKLPPGITGFAQLESDTATLERRSMLEKKWIDSPNIYDYFFIIFCTFKKIVIRTGN